MASKYLKMSDVFKGVVKARHLDDECICEITKGDESGCHYSIEDGRYWIATTEEHQVYAAHAINSHDELVEQRDKMLKALKEAVDCGIVPSSSAKEGGAAKYARQVIVADMIREAIALVDGDKQ